MAFPDANARKRSQHTPSQGPTAGSKRQLILERIMDRPGIHKSQLCRDLDLKWSTATHHIRRLVHAGEVLLSPAGRKTRLYPPGVPDRHATWLAHLNNPVDAAILQELSREEGLRVRDLGERLAYGPRVIRRHLASMVAAGLVMSDGAYNRRFRVRTAFGSRTGAPPAGPGPTLWESAATSSRGPLRNEAAATTSDDEEQGQEGKQRGRA